jgi:hypothetical protein
VQQTACTWSFGSHGELCVISTILVLVTAIAIDLASDFTTLPSSTVHVDVGGSCPDCFDQFVNFSGVKSLGSCLSSGGNVWTYIGGKNSSGYRRGRRWTWLRTPGPLPRFVHRNTVIPTITAIKLSLQFCRSQMAQKDLFIPFHLTFCVFDGLPLPCSPSWQYVFWHSISTAHF